MDLDEFMSDNLEKDLTIDQLCDKDGSAQNGLILNKEDNANELKKYFEEQERREREKRAKQIRFHNRRKFDELVKPILSLEIISNFY
jgi:hypothetical protein